MQEKGAYAALLNATARFVTDEITLEAVTDVLRLQAAYQGGALALAHGQLVNALTRAFATACSDSGTHSLALIIKVGSRAWGLKKLPG